MNSHVNTRIYRRIINREFKNGPKNFLIKYNLCKVEKVNTMKKQRPT